MACLFVFILSCFVFVCKLVVVFFMQAKLPTSRLEVLIGFICCNVCARTRSKGFCVFFCFVFTSFVLVRLYCYNHPLLVCTKFEVQCVFHVQFVDLLFPFSDGIQRLLVSWGFVRYI